MLLSWCIPYLAAQAMHANHTAYIKGIVTDSNNIFLRHKSEDIDKKGYFPKFQLILILLLQVMHD